MQITIKYFASLREQQGKTEEQISLASAVPVAKIWQNIEGAETSTPILFAINKQYVTPETLVKEGDEVAFLPPITGG